MFATRAGTAPRDRRGSPLLGGTRAARVVVVALFLASALVAPGLAGPAAVTAADGMEHSAAVTYLVNVDAGRLDVTNVLTVKNTAGSAYYLAGAYVVLEGDAANVRVQPSSGTASIALSPVSYTHLTLPTKA